MPSRSLNEEKRTRGRPRRFDREVAVGQAMRLFWERGYEGATFDELIAAMSLSPSSFYNAFGSKEKLYREAISFYIENHAGFFRHLSDVSVSGHTAFERFLSAAAEAFTDLDAPPGCMISLAFTTDSSETMELSKLLQSLRRESRRLMEARLAACVSVGDIPSDTDTDALAGYFEAIYRGMAVQARDGASLDALLFTVRLSMQVWPRFASCEKERV